MFPDPKNSTHDLFKDEIEVSVTLVGGMRIVFRHEFYYKRYERDIKLVESLHTCIKTNKLDVLYFNSFLVLKSSCIIHT